MVDVKIIETTDAVKRDEKFDPNKSQIAHDTVTGSNKLKPTFIITGTICEVSIIF